MFATRQGKPRLNKYRRYPVEMAMALALTQKIERDADAQVDTPICVDSSLIL